MNIKIKNSILFLLFSILLGAICGFIVWLFFRIMNIGIDFLWGYLPSKITIPFYTILLCTLGGLIIGIWRKKFGDYPEDLAVIMDKVKNEKKYPYHNLPVVSVSALLPLLFGGSIGPEAGLTGVIVGLCYWVSDRFKFAFSELKELTQIGISATLGAIFHSPMFAFVEPIEEENSNTTLPNTFKIVVYFLAIFGALGIFLFLNHLLGGKGGLGSFSGFSISAREWIFLLPLALLGTFFGFIYHITHKGISKAVLPLKKYPILSCILSGLILGIVGTILPYTMFSGEHQMVELQSTWLNLGFLTLFLTGIFKILLTNTCILMGFKGGHFFPVIFAGVSLGYAFSILTGTNPVFTVTIITSSLMSCIMRKPLATVFLLMICFPTEAFLPMLLAAIIGSTPKLPNESIK